VSDFALEPCPKYSAGVDFYPTPAWTTRALLNFCPPTDLYGESFLDMLIEPCAGDGAIVRELRAAYPRANIVAIELRDTAAALAAAGASTIICADFFSTTIAHNASVIGNPPFSLAFEFAEKCVDSLARYVALLLRLNFLASAARKDFINAHPPSHLGILSRRPSFTADGKTDSSDYAWFVWDRSCADLMHTRIRSL